MTKRLSLMAMMLMVIFMISGCGLFTVPDTDTELEQTAQIVGAVIKVKVPDPTRTEILTYAKGALLAAQTGQITTDQLLIAVDKLVQVAGKDKIGLYIDKVSGKMKALDAKYGKVNDKVVIVLAAFVKGLEQ